MTGSEAGPDIRGGVSSRPRVRRPGLTVLVVLAATMSPATLHLVAPGADPGRIGLGIAGAQHPEVAGEGTLVVHTAVRDVRQAGPVTVRDIGNVSRPRASCDGRFCPVVPRTPTRDESIDQSHAALSPVVVACRQENAQRTRRATQASSLGSNLRSMAIPHRRSGHAGGPIVRGAGPGRAASW
jgi:hypothetical protein